MSEDFIDSPIISFEKPRAKRGYIIYLGRIMYRATAVRMDQFRKDFRKCANQGMTLRQAAKRIGYSIPTMMKWASIFKLDFAKERKRTSYRYNKDGWNEIILDCLNKGQTYEQIDELLNVPRNNTYMYCKRHNINAREIKLNAKAN